MISKSYTIPKSVMVQSVDDETLLFDSAMGMFFGLNEMGAIFWECMNTHSAVGDVYSELSNAFDVEPEQLESDLALFVSSLAQQGLVVFSE